MLEEGVELLELVARVVDPAGQPLAGIRLPPSDFRAEGLLGDVLVLDPQSSATVLSDTDRVVVGAPKVVVVMMNFSADIVRQAHRGPGSFSTKLVSGEAIQVAHNIVMLPCLVRESNHSAVREEAVGEVVYQVPGLAPEHILSCGLHRVIAEAFEQLQEGLRVVVAGPVGGASAFLHSVCSHL